MSLSLQTKRFINSEQVGSYAEITMEVGRHEESQPIRIHYMDEGSGEPLLLIHTIGQSMYTWNRIYKQLSGYYRVIAIDLVGHGYSDKPQNFAYDPESMADAIKLFLDKLKIRSAHLVCYSMSCAYGLMFASKYPNHVGRMALISPGGITPEMPLAVRMAGMPMLGGLSMMLMSYKKVDALLRECFLDLTLVGSQTVTEYYEPLVDSDAKRAISRALYNYDEDEAVRSVCNVKAPTLIMWPSEDKWHSSELCEIYHSALSGSGYTVIRNAGHLAHEEKPDKVLAALLEFIPVPMPGEKSEEILPEAENSSDETPAQSTEPETESETDAEKPAADFVRPPEFIMAPNYVRKNESSDEDSSANA